MITHIDESIRVGAIFGNGKKIRPVWFVWNGRKYRITEVTYSWMSREGRAAVHHFSVTDGNGLFEICYNAETLVWSLRAVETE